MEPSSEHGASVYSQEMYDSAKVVLSDQLNLSGPTIDKPEIGECDPYKLELISGNLTLRLYELPKLQDKFGSASEGAKNRGHGLAGNEHYVREGRLNHNNLSLAWFVTAKSKIRG